MGPGPSLLLWHALLALLLSSIPVPSANVEMPHKCNHAQLHATARIRRPHLKSLQADAPALVLQGLAVKLGPTFVKLAQTLRWGRPAGGPVGAGPGPRCGACRMPTHPPLRPPATEAAGPAERVQCAVKVRTVMAAGGSQSCKQQARNRRRLDAAPTLCQGTPTHSPARPCPPCSMRPDLIGESYAAALAELQDNVAPFDTATAWEIIESELGAPVAEVFSSISPKPIASASLGQVGRAAREPGKRGGTSAVLRVLQGQYEQWAG